MTEQHDTNSPADDLAGYLGDELDAESRRRFEAALENDANLAASVRELRSALGAMRSLAPSPRASAPGPGSIIRRRTGLSTATRYAAAALLAFTAGYLLRGHGSAPQEPSAPADASPAAVTDAQSQTNLARLGAAYAGARSDSSLARALTALATIGGEPRPEPQVN